jgi:hypothetical protein
MAMVPEWKRNETKLVVVVVVVVAGGKLWVVMLLAFVSCDPGSLCTCTASGTQYLNLREMTNPVTSLLQGGLGCLPEES